MAKKLKTYVTSVGFFDQAVAAPSMKAALEAWGSKSNLFHQGFAKEADEPAIVEATMAKPGVVLKRPIGSNKPFSESAELPTHLLDDSPARPTRPSGGRNAPAKKASDKKASDKKINEKSAHKAALAFEREQKKREQERAKQEAERARERERREADVAKAQAAFDKAEREHLERAGLIEEQLAAVEERAQAEKARWEEQKKKLQDALRRARGRV